jgi:hypothetical protein
MPAATSTVREYVAWLADEGRTLSTITAYLAAIASAITSIRCFTVDNCA